MRRKVHIEFPLDTTVRSSSHLFVGSVRHNGLTRQFLSPMKQGRWIVEHGRHTSGRRGGGGGYHKEDCHLIGLKKGLDTPVMGTGRLVSIVIVHADRQATGGSVDLGQQQVGVPRKMLNDAEIAALGSEQEF